MPSTSRQSLKSIRFSMRPRCGSFSVVLADAGRPLAAIDFHEPFGVVQRKSEPFERLIAAFAVIAAAAAIAAVTAIAAADVADGSLLRMSQQEDGVRQPEILEVRADPRAFHGSVGLAGKTAALPPDSHRTRCW